MLPGRSQVRYFHVFWPGRKRDTYDKLDFSNSAQVYLDRFKLLKNAWYFIQQLELRLEAARAWNLRDLNLNSMSPKKDPSYHHPDNHSDVLLTLSL